MKIMKFEQIVKNISSIFSGVLIFLMAATFYMSAKGFEINENGDIVLVKQAMAVEQDDQPKEIPLNYVFPQDHFVGSVDAPVVLYEYSSFGCFHCADFHLDVLPDIQREYVEKGLVKLVFVPLPLDKNSMDAALLAECVEKDKYFAFVDVLFKKQNDWGMAFNPQKVLLQYAALSGLGNEEALACLKNDANATQILTNRQAGLTDLGIKGTPTFIVSSKHDNEVVAGLKTYDEFKSIIDAHLAKK